MRRFQLTAADIASIATSGLVAVVVVLAATEAWLRREAGR